MHASLTFFRRPHSSALRRRVGIALLAVSTVAAAPAARAQDPRPWLVWRTIETPNFVLHYSDGYHDWARALAERIDGVRDQVGRVVGFLPPRRVHIIVDDPANDANGEAYTPLDAPTIVLWPTPPDPRDQTGNFRVWGELLATHEFAHVAHLARPSRNRWRSLLWGLSPVPLGPIATEAPRWAIEGYATYVEGRATGTGRPNHAWRAAILRQFALEGTLPSYRLLSTTGGWQTGNFAYLAGSAFIEWLARREGDSSVTAIWRRMTAKTNRSFDAAFAGVYGGSPSQLYGRFSAEITADALAFERALARDALVPGTMVQHLSRSTGDPAISPDGRFVALAVRRTDAPSQIIVWKTEDEPDTSSARRREQQITRDADDVPDRQFYPAPKRIIISLAANDGAPYESPRWMADNKHLLLTRRVPTPDGSLRGDLFLWNAEDGGLTRVTSGAALRDADPSLDGGWAAAVRCDHGWCDLVRVDLNTGHVGVLRAGSVTRNYYRPRISRTTGEIVVSEQLGDRWRIARVSSTDGALRYADPDDGVTRYDATYDVDGRTIITTSEAGGVANLERLSADDSGPTRLTAVTGAAVGADVAPDGSLWFLSLHAEGYDLRRIKPDSASLARAQHASAPLHLALVDSLSPVLPPRNRRTPSDSTLRPATAVIGEEHDYGMGPSRFRYLPAYSTGYGGSTVQFGIVRSDPVGRLGIALLASVGAGALPEGIALDITSRLSRTNIIGSLWTSHEAPSRQLADAYDLGLDLSRFGGAARFQRLHVSDGGERLTSLAILAEIQSPSALSFATRTAAVATMHIVRRQRDDETRYLEQLSVLAEAGQTEGGGYLRQRSSLLIGTANGSRPLATARLSYGTIGVGVGSLRERYVIGGFASPLLDPMLDARRVEAPAYPVGSAAGVSFSSFRAALPVASIELFYAGASPDLFKTSRRSYGTELRQHFPAIPALGTPEVNLLAGFARAVDEPVKGEWRYYVSVGLRP